MVPPAEVPGIAATITYVIAEHMSPGQVDEALAELPGEPARHHPGRGRRDGAGRAARRRPVLDATLDERLEMLTEAVRTLARGLEGNATGGPRTPPRSPGPLDWPRTCWSAAGR